MEYKDAGQGYISYTSTETGGKEVVVIMGPDKLVGGRVEVASQSHARDTRLRWKKEMAHSWG